MTRRDEFVTYVPPRIRGARENILQDIVEKILTNQSKREGKLTEIILPDNPQEELSSILGDIKSAKKDRGFFEFDFNQNGDTTIITYEQMVNILDEIMIACDRKEITAFHKEITEIKKLHDEYQKVLKKIQSEDITRRFDGLGSGGSGEPGLGGGGGSGEYGLGGGRDEYGLGGGGGSGEYGLGGGGRDEYGLGGVSGEPCLGGGGGRGEPGLGGVSGGGSSKKMVNINLPIIDDEDMATLDPLKKIELLSKKYRQLEHSEQLDFIINIICGKNNIFSSADVETLVKNYDNETDLDVTGLTTNEQIASRYVEALNNAIFIKSTLPATAVEPGTVIRQLEESKKSGRYDA